MTPKWMLDAELADTLELARVRRHAQRYHDERDRDLRVEQAFDSAFPVMARLLSVMPPECLVDRELHAANVALTVGAFKSRRNTTATGPEVVVAAGPVAEGNSR